MKFDEQGNKVDEPSVPEVIDKLGPVQQMRIRRMRHDLLESCHHGDTEDRRMLVDALDYVQTFSEDAFSRLMAAQALGRRP
jgi:hypothetical protein